MKQQIAKLIPSSILTKYKVAKCNSELNNLSFIDFDDSNLRAYKESELKSIFTNKETTKNWDNVVSTIKSLDFPEMAGGVNPGDQRALFYLINSLQPKNVLEVGTHIGCSTTLISLALKGSSSSLTTVDILDVNDTVKKPWLNFGSHHSPIEMVKKIDCSDMVTFKVQNSAEYLAEAKEKYDFIFLDGSHEAGIVFQEVPLALNLLKKGGVILLHDYFPNNEPLWSNKFCIPGPYMAMKKIMEKNPSLKVIPLGELPWPTKLGSNVTSLAILTKN